MVIVSSYLLVDVILEMIRVLRLVLLDSIGQAFLKKKQTSIVKPLV